MWIPDASTRALDATHPSLPIDEGAPYDPSSCAHELTPLALRLANALRVQWPWTPRSYRPDCAPLVRSAHPRLSLHSEGRALDVMIPAGPLRKERGDTIAGWLVQNAPALGVQRVIWDNAIWQSERPPASRWSAYHPLGDLASATQRHEDHVHVEVRREGSPLAASPLPSTLRRVAHQASAAKPPVDSAGKQPAATQSFGQNASEIDAGLPSAGRPADASQSRPEGFWLLVAIYLAARRIARR